MVVLGLLLLALSGVLTVAVIVQNTDPVAASAFGHSIAGLTVGRLFLAGVITGGVAILGVLMMAAGASRRRSRRTGLKRQVRDARGEKESLAEENARLQRELETSRSDAGVYPTDGPTPGRHGERADTAPGRHGLFRR